MKSIIGYAMLLFLSMGGEKISGIIENRRQIVASRISHLRQEGKESFMEVNICSVCMVRE